MTARHSIRIAFLGVFFVKCYICIRSPKSQTLCHYLVLFEAHGCNPRPIPNCISKYLSRSSQNYIGSHSKVNTACEEAWRFGQVIKLVQR